MRGFCFSEGKVVWCSIPVKLLCTRRAPARISRSMSQKICGVIQTQVCTRFASNSTLSTTFWLFPGWKWKYGDKAVSSCPTIHHIVSLGQNKSIFFFFQCRFRSEPDMPWMFYLNFLEFGLMITYKNICLASLIFILWNRGTFNGRLVHSHYNIKLNNAAPKWSAWLS